MTSPRRIGPRGQAITVVIAVIAVIAAVLVPFRPESASAASAADFQDGYIISDHNFFDYSSMDAVAVQAFLNARVSQCVGANGQPCLKDYATTAEAIAPDSVCQGMPGGRLSAAQIIVAAAQSCRISPKVLIVMLQKEQGLITATSPTEWNYRAAMGQSCPDTAPCDSALSGFYRQVYYAARQFQIYMKYPGSFAYRIGWNNILYSPNTACGTKSVYIQNDATRALYIYTPYTPNTAALNNLYGTGDACSAYGNRNFWRTFSDWFGPPTGGPGELAIFQAYNALGGPSSWLGPATSPTVCGIKDNGCWQTFQGGPILYSPATGAQPMLPVMHTAWGTQGYENGWMGYPTSPTVCGIKDNGCWQTFQGGPLLYSPATGAQPMRPVMHTAWGTQGYENGWMGYPTSPTVCGIKDNGCWQTFQGGPMLYSPATGAQPMLPALHTVWGTQGYENGWLGYPTSGSQPVSTGGHTQTFQGGTITVAGNGTVAFTGAGANAPRAAIASELLTAPWLGGANTPVVCGSLNGGCWQAFQGGVIMYSPATGAKSVRSFIHESWVRQGYENGWMGYPTSPTVCGIKDNGCWQTFQGGPILYSPATGAQPMLPVMHTAWGTQGYENGWMGYPTSPTVCGIKDKGCWQTFQGGPILYSPATGAQSMVAAMHAAWGTQGYENGWLGFPTSGSQPISTGGHTQTFQGGTITLAGNGTVAFTGASNIADAAAKAAVATKYVALGGGSSWLGGITTPIVCGSTRGGCWQAYQHGVIMYSPATGAQEVRPETHAGWIQQGYEYGWMGYPTSPSTCGLSRGGCTQSFESGRVVYSPATGSTALRPFIDAAWATQGSQDGWMGYPTTPTVCGGRNGGCWQAFQSGVIMYSPATGAKAVRPQIHAVWVSQGYENGWLGYPTTDSVAVTGGGYTQTFQGGTIAVDGNGTATITAR